MEERTFGASDLRTSVIGFGTWPIGGTFVKEGYGGVDDQQAIDAIRRAVDLGVTCFDTAPAYGAGHSEEVLGKALGARRKDIVLVTKCGISLPPGSKTNVRDSTIPAVGASGAIAGLLAAYLVLRPGATRPTRTCWSRPRRACGGCGPTTST